MYVEQVEQTVTYLEMTSPDQLQPGREPPQEITLDRVDATAAALVRATHDRLAAPHQWSSLIWSEQLWVGVLTSPVSRCWLARVGVDVVGLLRIRIPGPDAEINMFGLVPEFVGRGFGGHFLTLATRLAWDVPGVNRVWLHTSSLDHPNALHNYRNRGFRPYRVEHRPRGMLM